MSEYAVGKEVVSWCGKCKLGLAHVICTMDDTKSIGKVECKTCKGTHKFKDPALQKTKKKATTRKRKVTPKIPVGDLWLQEMNAATAESQKYAISGKFAKGDVIAHAKFGDGIVQEVISGKIEVLFKEAIKTLVHCR